MNRTDAKQRQVAPARTPTDLSPAATKDISAALTALLADTFALYLKTKNFHWHISGPNFREYHLMLDEQGEQIFATTDAIAERARKIGGTTLRSISHISRLQRILDNDANYVTPRDMIAELAGDNLELVKYITISQPQAVSRIGLMKASEGFGSCMSPREFRRNGLMSWETFHLSRRLQSRTTPLLSLSTGALLAYLFLPAAACGNKIRGHVGMRYERQIVRHLPQ